MENGKARLRQVYFIEAAQLGLVKIGSATDAKSRLRTLQVGSPDRLTLRAILPADDAQRLEKQLHDTFAPQRVRGEWFEQDDELRGFVDALEAFAGTLSYLFNPPASSPKSTVIVQGWNEPHSSFSERAWDAYVFATTPNKGGRPRYQRPAR